MTLEMLRHHGVTVEAGDDEWRVAPGRSPPAIG